MKIRSSEEFKIIIIKKMNQEKLENLTDEQLLEQVKKNKSGNILNAVLIGLLIGIGIYSSVKNGFGFFTVFPLFYVFILWKSGKDKKELDKEMANRNLQ